MYSVKFKKSVEKKLSKLERATQYILMGWIKKNLVNVENPRMMGKALKGNKKDLWRYRVGDYRIIADIDDGEVKIILIVNVGHRKEIYK